MIGRWNNNFLLPRQSIATRQGGGVRVETMDFLCRECVAVSGTMDLLCRGEGGEGGRVGCVRVVKDTLCQKGEGITMEDNGLKSIQYVQYLWSLPWKHCIKMCHETRKFNYITKFIKSHPMRGRLHGHVRCLQLINFNRVVVTALIKSNYSIK